jgi:hypothetical protein
VSAHRAELGNLQMGAALLSAAVLDAWTALQMRDFGSLAGAGTTLRLAIDLCFPRFEWPQIRGFISSLFRNSEFAGR